MRLQMGWRGTVLGGLLGLGLVSCGGGSDFQPLSSAAISVQVSPADLELTAGGQATFQATVSHASNTGVTWSVKEGAAGGSIDANGLYTAPSAAGTYTIVAASKQDAKVKATAKAIVAAKPALASFAPAQAFISPGGSTTLTASFTGTSAVVDNGVGTVHSGAAVTVNPAATTTYTIQVSNAAGSSVSGTATVTVAPLPAAAALVAGASTINAGGSTTLTATFTNGVGSVDHGIGAVASDVPFTVNPAATTTYTLTVMSPAGATATQTATVTVVPAPRVSSFTSSLGSLFKGQSATLMPVFTGGSGSIAGLGAVSSGTSVPVSPATTTTYTLTVTSATGATDTASLAITVDATPFSIASFSATPAQVDFGQASSLAWALNGTATTLTLDGASVLGDPASLAVHPVRRQSYVLSGSNPLGGDQKIMKVAARGLDLVAGNVDGFGYQDGPIASARFGNLSGIVRDAAGNLYVGDYTQQVIRKVTSAGVVSTFAGTLGSYGTNDGTTTAQFEAPNGMAIDGSGNLYVSDEYACTIRMIAPDGTVSTLAGWAGHGGYNDATGLAAQFNRPCGLAVDPAGNVFVADTYNSVIRMITPGGVVSTIAGQANNAAYLNGPGTVALYNFPRDITLDANGNLYVADDGNHVIRKITPSDPAHGAGTTWTSSLLAGTPGSNGYKDDPSAPLFGTLWGLMVDASGNVYSTDFYYHTIRKATPAGAVTTVAGGIYIPDHADGSALAARFNNPYRLFSDGSGGILVSEWNNTDIRHLAGGAVSTVAGTSAQGSPKDGTTATGRFQLPLGLALDPAGDLFVADRSSSTLREIGADGAVSTVAGQFDSYATADGQGSDARFVWPTGLARNASGAVYVSDAYAQVIRKVSASGFVSTVAGDPTQPGAYANGGGAAARFNNPQGIALDGSGNLFIADCYNHVIRKMTPGGIVSLFAGIPNQAGFLDGALGTGKLSYPTGLAFDASGNLVVADSGNHAIRRIAPDGSIATITGGAGVGNGYWGFQNGDALTARFHNPTGVALDAAGNIFVADHDNHAVRKVLPDGSSTTTIAGQPGLSGTALGALPATLYQPWGILATPDGDLLVSTANGIVQITAP